MAVGIKLGNITDEIGTSDFLYAFFSTVSGNLEPKGWGSRFPTLMKKLYADELYQADAAAALSELNSVSNELAVLPKEKIIWNIDDRKKVPPWGSNIASTITDLSNYFITSTGRDLITILREVLEELRYSGGVAKIVNY